MGMTQPTGIFLSLLDFLHLSQRHIHCIRQILNTHYILMKYQIKNHYWISTRH